MLKIRPLNFYSMVIKKSNFFVSLLDYMLHIYNKRNTEPNVGHGRTESASNIQLYADGFQLQDLDLIV